MIPAVLKWALSSSHSKDDSTEPKQGSAAFAVSVLKRFLWAPTIQHSPSSSPRSLVARTNFTPRSFNKVFEKSVGGSEDPELVYLMLIKAMNTLELDQIGCSTSFLTTFKNISELLQNSPEKFRALMKATPTDLYYMYPGLCKTKEQIEIVVEAALENEGKFRGITNEVLTHFGDRRDEEYLTELYRHCLEKIIEKKGSDLLIVECLTSIAGALGPDQFAALKTLKNAPQVQKVIAGKPSCP